METQAYRGPQISVFIRQESLTAVTDDSKISVALTQCKCISYFWHRLLREEVGERGSAQSFKSPPSFLM